MREILLGLIASTALATAACAQEDAPLNDMPAPDIVEPPAMQKDALSEGQRLARLAFKSVDTTGKGYLHTGDIETYRDSVFASMDYDASETVDLNEFMSWDYGFQNEADTLDKRREYDTAIKTVFTIWDRNGDGSLTAAEHRFALRAEFDRMDINGNSILEEDEFLRGFSVMAAIRSALKED